VPDGGCASATELVPANNEAAQISVRKFLIAALSSFMHQTVPLAAIDLFDCAAHQ
jgi:hypothetical protein